MCRAHWAKVPKPIQRAVWNTYRPGQCDDKRPSAEWHHAADAAIGYVAKVGGLGVTAKEEAAIESFFAKIDLPTSGYDRAKAAGADCENCILGGKRRVDQFSEPLGPVFSRGSDKPKLVILGEGPGFSEVLKGEPFVGKSGGLLNQLLDEAGIDRGECLLVNVSACRPEEDWQKAPSAVCCSSRLSKELAATDPKVPILALGAIALKATLGISSILRSRGFVWKAPIIDEKKLRAAAKTREKAGLRLEKAAARNVDRKILAQQEKRKHREGFDLLRAKEGFSKAEIVEKLLRARAPLGGRTIIPSVHPSFILRGADGWRPIISADVKRVARLAEAREEGREFPLVDEPRPLVAATAKELKRILAKMKKTVAVDIETDGIDPLQCAIVCVGISDAAPDDWGTTVVAYPWKPSMGKVLNTALKNRTVSTHNGPAFDTIALERIGVTIPHLEDTLMAHHAFAAHVPQRLAHVAATYLDIGPWKQKHVGKGASEEKGESPWDVGGEELIHYNGADARAQSILWHRLQPDLKSEQEIYKHDMQLSAICRRMQIVGIRVDDERRAYLSELLKKRAAGLLGSMRKLVGSSGFNPNKPNDIRAALFGRFKAPVLSYTPTGLKGTGAAVLEALSEQDTRAGRLSKKVIKFREARKTRSTFLSQLMISPDGRVHASWRNYGTVSGRWACRSPNLMNLPHAQGDNKEIDVRSIYIPSKGRVFLYFDVCFAKGTLIDTPVGAKSIESLKPGDLVFSYRKETRRPAVGKVNQSFSVGKKPIVKVTLDNGEAIRCTPDHKWLVCPNRQDDDPVERRADALQPGDRLLPFRKTLNKGSIRHPAKAREYLYAHKAIEYSVTHKEVALTVYGPRPEGYEVHHKDGNPLNNDPDNLEYKEEFSHRSEHGKEQASKQWADLKIRNKMVAGLRAKGKEWRETGRLAGENNPRWGDRRGRREATCSFCGKRFEHWAKEVRKYCSKECSGASNVKPRANCPCGNPCTRPKSKYCSRSCLFKFADMGFAPKPRPPCPVCGVPVQALQSKYCSRKCFGQSKRITVDLPACAVCGDTCRMAYHRFCSRKCYFTGKRNGLNHKVISVEPDGFDEVWSIGVEGDKTYALAAGVFVSNCQAEMRFAAYLSGDERFIREVESGDPYLARAIAIFPDGERLFTADPSGLSEMDKIARKDLRQLAKKASLACNYFAEAPGLFPRLYSEGVTFVIDGKRVAITYPVVEAVVDTIQGAYPAYRRFVLQNVDACRESGTMRSAIMGRLFFMGFYPKPQDVANRPIQSGIGDVMNMRLLEICPRLPPGCDLVAQVHDSCVFDCVHAEVDNVKEIIREVWDKPIVLKSNGRSFKLPIELKTGDSLGAFG